MPGISLAPTHLTRLLLKLSFILKMGKVLEDIEDFA